MALLTFMSIMDSINDCVEDGRLVLVEPLFPNTSMERKIYASQTVMELSEPPWPEDVTEDRAYRLRAEFDNYIGGRILGLCLEPFKAKEAFMGLLDPESKGIFDIRSRDPEPGLRVFGGFAEIDIFVALAWRLRKEMGSRADRDWRDARVTSSTLWTNLFGPYKPLTGGDIHDFISTNVFHV